MERGTAPVTLNDIVQTVAGYLKAVWPSRKVYADEIPQNADGAFYVAMEDVEQTRGLDRQQRRTVGVQVLYFLRGKDTLEYLEWADSMFDHFRMLDVGGRQVHLSNQSARNDSDGRYYQFLFDIDLRFVEAAPASEPMETLKTEEVVQ